MTVELAETKFDAFADDYFVFLALRYGLSHDRRIKVVPFTNRTWRSTMPDRLRRATEGNPQPQPITLTLQSNTGKPSEEAKKIGLRAAGFTEEQAEDLRHVDAALFINFDQPARMKETGERLLWNIVIAHHVLHMVELMTGQRIIDEPRNEHDYEERESLEHFNRFVAWCGGLDQMIDRYIPTKD